MVEVVPASGIQDAPLEIVDLSAVPDWSRLARQAEALADGTRIVLGVSDRPLPPKAAAALRPLTVTVAPQGPGRSWVAPAQGDLDREIDAVREAVRHAPLAALALDGVLRLTADPALSVRAAVTAESLAYSTLLGSHEFAEWRRRTPRRPVVVPEDPVILERVGQTLRITLNDPATRNAMSVTMRDGLLAALLLAECDERIRRVVLAGSGQSFCSGGHLDEFGTATDMAQAHLIRVRHHVGLAVHRLAGRVRAELHGNCVGSGVEVPAFAGEVLAARDATFWLPEVRFGLIPGAGGTVSITRRIGRWRTAYLGLTAHRLSAERALEWGLIDGIG